MSEVKSLNAKGAKDAALKTIGKCVVESALKVHSTLGPGLLETAYEACLAYELVKAGHRVRKQVLLPIRYDNQSVDAGFRIDILVEELVVIELKAIEAIHPVHPMQVLTYLRLGGYQLGFLLNFNVARMRDGIRRLVNGL